LQISIVENANTPETPITDSNTCIHGLEEQVGGEGQTKAKLRLSVGGMVKAKLDHALPFSPHEGSVEE
jgi:hypothetical protein